MQRFSFHFVNAASGKPVALTQFHCYLSCSLYLGLYYKRIVEDDVFQMCGEGQYLEAQNYLPGRRLYKLDLRHLFYIGGQPALFIVAIMRSVLTAVWHFCRWQGLLLSPQLSCEARSSNYS
ncbi:hypothetical protein [Microbulbifer sp. GL-2]|uniref:hypothetical protein n=1 Tax=Microbulbifer sp. GL-2 TaxID=2591606 RepID=UPI0011634FA6|nr:hypothetical protein [Microbulbifer sp. GL-2]BBM03678.1 hypothetical protein GL2_37520 [Microbulbifer sp. GL-2]